MQCKSNSDCYDASFDNLFISNDLRCWTEFQRQNVRAVGYLDVDEQFHHTFRQLEATDGNGLFDLGCKSLGSSWQCWNWKKAKELGTTSDPGPVVEGYIDRKFNDEAADLKDADVYIDALERDFAKDDD